MTPNGTARSPWDELQAALREDPDAVLVTFVGDRAYTRAEIAHDAARMAAALAGSGIEPGDRVAIVLGNRVEFVVTWLAIAAVGAVAVPINTAMQGNVLDHMLGLSGPRVIVAEVAFAAQLGPSLATCPSIELAVWLGADASVSGVDYREFVGAAPETRPEHEAGPADFATILFTSGTTGPSKGVMWSHRTAVAMAESAIFVMGYRPGDVVFTCLPLFHSNALFTTFFAALIRRAQVVVAQRFSASRFWEQVASSGATTISLLGAMVPILRKQAPTALDRAHRVRLALVVPLDAADEETFRARFGIACTSLYGLSDIGTPIGVPAGVARRPGSCGIVCPGWECLVADEYDEPVAPGEPGELLVRPLHPFMGQLGYWQMPEATVAAWRNLWFHTGDLVRADADGWYWFLDRSKDAIRRFGENISSYEVEQALTEHPYIAEAAVYAVPSNLSEDEVMACVVAVPGVELDPREIVAWCAPRLPYFAVPRFIDVVADLPKTPTLKVRKDRLRATGVTRATFDRGPVGRAAGQVAR